MNQKKIQTNFEKLKKVVEQIRTKFADQQAKTMFSNYVETFVTKLKDNHDKEFFEAFKQFARNYLIVKEETILNYRNTLSMLLLLNTILRRIEPRMTKQYNNLNKNFFLKLWSDIYNHAIHIANLLGNNNESHLRVKIDSENYYIFKLQLFTVLELMKKFVDLFQKKKKTKQLEIIKDIEKRTVQAGLNPNENLEMELDIIDENTDIINQIKKPSCVISSAKKANVRFILKSLEKNREEIYGFISNDNIDFYEFNDLTSNYIKNFQKLQDLVKSSKTERLTFEIENKFKKEYYFSEFLISISQQTHDGQDFQLEQILQIIKEKYQQIFLQNLQPQKTSVIEEDPFQEQYEEIQNQTLDSKMSKHKPHMSQTYSDQFLKPNSFQKDVTLHNSKIDSLSSISHDVKSNKKTSLIDNQKTFENQNFFTFKQKPENAQIPSKIDTQDSRYFQSNLSQQVNFSKAQNTNRSHIKQESSLKQNQLPKITFSNFFGDNQLSESKKFQSSNYMKNSLFTNKGSIVETGPQFKNKIKQSIPNTLQPTQQSSDLKFSEVISKQTNANFQKQNKNSQFHNDSIKNSLKSSVQFRNSNVSLSFKKKSLTQNKNIQKQPQQTIKPNIQIEMNSQKKPSIQQKIESKNQSFDEDDLSLKSFVNNTDNNDLKKSFNIDDFNSADFMESEPQVSSDLFKKKQSSYERALLEQQNLSNTKLKSHHKKNVKSLTLNSDPQTMEMDVYYQAQKDKIFDQIRNEIKNTDYKIQNRIGDLLFELWSLINDYVSTKQQQKESFSDRYIQDQSQGNLKNLQNENKNLKQMNDILKNTNDQLEQMKQFEIEKVKKETQILIEQKQQEKNQILLNQIQQLQNENLKMQQNQRVNQIIKKTDKKKQITKLRSAFERIQQMNLDIITANQAHQKTYTVKHQLNLLKLIVKNKKNRTNDFNHLLNLQQLKKQITQYKQNLKNLVDSKIFNWYKGQLQQQKGKIHFQKSKLKNFNKKSQENIFLQQRIVELYGKINDLQETSRILKDENQLYKSQNFDLNLANSQSQQDRSNDLKLQLKKISKEAQCLADENHVLSQKILELETQNRDLKNRKQNNCSTQLIELNRENRKLQDIIKQYNKKQQKHSYHQKNFQQPFNSDKKERNSLMSSQKTTLKSSQQLETYSNRGINFLNRFEMMLDLPTQDKQFDKYESYMNYVIMNQQKDFTEQILQRYYTIHKNHNLTIDVHEKFKKVQGYFHFNYELKVSNMCFSQINLFNIKLNTKSNYVKFRKNQTFENLIIGKRDIKSIEFDVIFKENYLLEMLPLKMSFNTLIGDELTQEKYKQQKFKLDNFKEIYFPITVNKLVEFVQDSISLQIVDQLRQVNSIKVNDEQNFIPGQLQKLFPNLQKISSKLYGVKMQSIYGSTIIIIDFRDSFDRQINFYSVEKNVIHVQFEKLLKYVLSKINQNKN